MLTFSSNQRMFLACGSTDLCKSIDGLAAIVQESFGLDPFSFSLFVFCNGADFNDLLARRKLWLFQAGSSVGCWMVFHSANGKLIPRSMPFPSFSQEKHVDIPTLESLQQQIIELSAKLKWYEEQFRLA